MSEHRPDPGAAAAESKNFVSQAIEADLAEGRYPEVRTRFPPEPNGYPHIGHAKAICVDFGMAAQFGGRCNLRFDDTNPSAEEQEYVDAIQADIRWLGFDWGEHLYFASDFFEQLYTFAEHLIQSGEAYVDDQTVEAIRAGRGDRSRPGDPGVDSPFRGRSPEENLDLFRRMRAGEFDDGSRVLRAKISMGASNLLMRDPVLYRIQRSHHHRTGDAWCIYPTYDFAHGQCDAFEGVTHSLCSLEFRNHRDLYDWLRDRIPSELLGAEWRPRQIEFARLKLTHTLVSKRQLRLLVEEQHVEGWDDPRMPTLRGLRRRGYTPTAIRNFCERIGLSKADSRHSISWLEDSLREDLNKSATRRMAVLRPLKVVLTNLEPGERLAGEALNNPEDDAAGVRPLAVTRELWIERDDFMLEAPRKFFRLRPGGEVRLRYGYVIRCDEVQQDAAGEISELHCTLDRDTGQGQAPADGRKVKGIIHWVSAEDALEAEVRLYDHLFAAEDPAEFEEGGSFIDNLNPSSLEVLKGCRLERALANAEPGEAFQFERLGYFIRTGEPESGAGLCFLRAVTLRDSWAKAKGKR